MAVFNEFLRITRLRVLTIESIVMTLRYIAINLTALDTLQVFNQKMSLGFSSIFKGCFCGRDSIIIKSRKYYIQEVIGEGGFSKVYLVENNENKKLYAVKKLVCHSIEDQQVALSEINVHQKINHENVIKLIDYEINGTPDPIRNSTSQVYLVLPYYKRGTLHHELEKRSALSKPFTPIQVLEMFLKICSGVRAFHECQEPIAHRDLKTANILLDADDTPIIMDLGSAAPARVTINSLSDAQNLQDLAAERCSMPYRSPELFNVENHSIIDERTDIWSLGCILYAMCFFKSPYDIVYERGDSVALAVLNGVVKFPDDHIYGKDMEDLIKFLLKVNPAERPYIENVVEKVETTLKKFSVSV